MTAWAIGWALTAFVLSFLGGLALRRYVRQEVGEAFGRGIIVGRAFARLSPEQAAEMLSGKTQDSP